MERCRTASRLHKKPLALSDSAFAYCMLIPAIAVLSLVILMPIAKGIYVSFCNYKISNLNNPEWNNLQNYIKIFEDGAILKYFKNTFLYVGCTVTINFILGLSIALLLNSNIKGRNVFRGLLILPWTIPSVVVAIIWRWMFQQQYGALNYILHWSGVTDTVNIAWSMNPVLAMISIIIATVWRNFPYMMVMLLAGLQSVNQSQLEAAKIEGASNWQTLTKITLPSIRPVISSTVWIAIMSAFQQFTIIKNLTGGGPFETTTTLSIAAYQAAFVSFDFGKGAAIGVLWLVVLFIASMINNKINEKYSAD